MIPTAHHLARWCVLGLLPVLLGACTTLPPLPPRKDSTAVHDAGTQTTRLAALELASLSGAMPGV